MARSPLGTRFAWTHVGLVYAFMYLPVAVIALFSFNASAIIAFPLQGFTLDWYARILVDARILGGLGVTFAVAIPTAVLSTVLGAMAALALTRHALRWRKTFACLLFLPFLVPKVILAVAQLIVLSELGITKGVTTMVLGQTLIILPFTTLVIASVLIRLDRRLEEAAADLGASRAQIFRRVLFPLMKNGLLAAFFVAFVLSSSEYVVTSFLSGRSQPLSILVASDFRFNLSPTLDALAVLMVTANLALVAIGEIIRLRARR
ncbi:ABC transporter permease [Siculibacillus lacustris]|uniref:ABC transporter permease n=1 Tax=Siculibacillus lacustris TaxID=1549641 RepID=A0A4Q9VRD4_9HYPH|nr:ABC transporter permease [Siculibacillus lacustris]TBW38439.1 ABC transporter permease [Siculibacillus lacustris]